MRSLTRFTLAAVALAATAAFAFQDPDRIVPGGGIFGAGWKGRIDPQSAKAGRTINDSTFEVNGNTITIAAGPAAVYWNPANTASRDYTISATFREPKMMSANSHAHPYGIFIAGGSMDSGNPSLLYCSVYGTGQVLVRGFSGGVVFTPLGRAPNAAANKAGEDGSVTQTIQWSVKGGRAECSVNGTVVAGYKKDELVAAGKLSSLDGVYGIRVSHNLDVVVSDLKKQ